VPRQGENDILAIERQVQPLDEAQPAEGLEGRGRGGADRQRAGQPAFDPVDGVSPRDQRGLRVIGRELDGRLLVPAPILVKESHGLCLL
jgi:hypothetical protein